MDINLYHIEIKRHAFIRALQRGITPDLVESAIKGGRQLRFGKNRIKFVKKFKKFTVICVDEIIGGIIRIVTIEKK
ncbi:hypothetical protein JW851_04990 [Candidatus Woesearchaeota archaeon]|nr:hypothetical protein [Candidatus Woesearchaeota archaeon]